eukprot:4999686-Pyramimonas_sp.AAC.2
MGSETALSPCRSWTLAGYRYGRVHVEWKTGVCPGGSETAPSPCGVISIRCLNQPFAERHLGGDRGESTVRRVPPGRR